MTVFQDDDGKAHLIHSSDGNKTTVIAGLSDDYLSPSRRFERAFVGRFMEAPAVFKRLGKYHFIASGCTGWAPNAARSAVADSIWGPWTEMKNPASGRGREKTFSSQGTFVLPVDEGRAGYMFLADRWNIKDLGASGYLWLPIRFAGDQAVIKKPKRTRRGLRHAFHAGRQ